LVALCVLLLFLGSLPSLLPAVDVTPARLHTGERSDGRAVRVHCDRIDAARWHERAPRSLGDTADIALCHLGPSVLAIRLPAGGTSPQDGVVVGDVRALPAAVAWTRSLEQAWPASFHDYLDVKHHGDNRRRALALIALSTLLVTVWLRLRAIEARRVARTDRAARPKPNSQS
jgi:hypothetical protein